MVPVGIPPWLEDTTVTVAGEVGFTASNSDDVGVVEDATNKLALLLAALGIAGAEDVSDFAEASLILK